MMYTFNRHVQNVNRAQGVSTFLDFFFLCHYVMTGIVVMFGDQTLITFELLSCENCVMWLGKLHSEVKGINTCR